MANPWEKYQQAEQPKAQPWQQFERPPAYNYVQPEEGQDERIQFEADGQVVTAPQGAGALYAEIENDPHFDAPVSTIGETAAAFEAQAGYLGYLAYVSGGISDEDAAGFIAGRMAGLKNARKNQPEYMRSLTESMAQKEGFFGKAFAAMAHPRALGRSFVTNSPNFVLPLLTGYGGMKAGVATGAGVALAAGQAGPQAALPEEVVTVPAASVIGGIAGFSVGTGAGSAMLEFGVEMDQIAAEMGYNTGNAQDLFEFFQNKEVMERAKTRAALKGFTTASVDAVFAAFGGKFIKMAANSGKVTKVAAATGDVAFQSVGEGASEAVGQKVARGEIDIDDVILEGMTGLAGSIGTSAIGASARGGKKIVGKVADAVGSDTAASDVPSDVEVVADSEVANTPQIDTENIDFTDIKTLKKLDDATLDTQAQKIEAQIADNDIQILRQVEELTQQKVNIEAVSEQLVTERQAATQEISNIEAQINQASTNTQVEGEAITAPQQQELKQQLQTAKTNLKALDSELKEQGITLEQIPQVEAQIAQNLEIDKNISQLQKDNNSQLKEFNNQVNSLQTVTTQRNADNILKAEGVVQDKKRVNDIQRLLNDKSKGKIKEKFSDVGKDLKRMTGVALTPISTRLKNVNPKLKARLRGYEFKLKRQVQNDETKILPFLEKYKKIKGDDKVILDYAMKNGDADIVNSVAKKYSMEAEMQNVREVLNDLYVRGDKANMDIGYKKDFFPRHVVDAEGLLGYFEKTELWGEISEGIKLKELEVGRILTDQEKAHLINTLLRGYKTANITLSKPGALKERAIDRVTADIDKFYNTSEQALIRYITVVNEAIETKEFFGKGSSGLIENIDDTVGFFILKELEAGTIKATDAKEISDIMKARFNRGQMSTFWRVYKNFSYIDTMGSPISALTQIGDLAFSMYKAGVYRTLKALPRALAGKSNITREDIGVEKIAQEFEENSTSAAAVNKVFKLVGLNKMDAIGKETIINSTFDKYKSVAKKNPESLRAELEVIFEGETDAVIKDLQNGKISENVKMLLFNSILDLQPVALSEMPEAYLKAGNGRIFYMLKTFTVKQIDVYRNEVFAQIRSGNTLQGMKNLTRLLAYFVMMNASADYLKDLVLGRDKEPEDYLVDNIIRAFAISKFQIYTARTEGIGSTAAKTILPPFKAVDGIYKDMAKAIDKGYVDMDNIKTIQSVPIGGKLYYWWLGGGSEDQKKRKF